MWIVFSRPGKGAGFVSIVAKDAAGKPSGPEPDAVVSARFRRKEDAAKLFPGLPYVPTPTGDYAGRVFITRRQAAEVLAQMMFEHTATNFKNSIPLDDRALTSACHKAWNVFGDLQEGGPYGRDVPRQQAYTARSPYLPGDWDDPVWRLPAKAPEGKGAKVRKAKRHDPFCDGCGMRYGAKNLDADGYCADCAGHLVVRSGEGPEWSPDDEPQASGPGECWNCANHVTARNRWKLCESCAHLYTDTDAELLDSIVAGLNVE